METGANVVESRALPWYAMLGNAAGKGRPSWAVSSAPLECSSGSRAPICRRIAAGDTPGAEGFSATIGGDADDASDDTDDDSVSFSAVLFLLFVVGVFSAGLGAVLTYTGIKGELPPLVADATELPRLIARKLAEMLNEGGGGAGAGLYSPTARGPPAAGGQMPAAPADWKWAQPPRPGQAPTAGGAAAPAKSGAPGASYGGV